jgi:hypothetical protein
MNKRSLSGVDNLVSISRACNAVNRREIQLASCYLIGDLPQTVANDKSTERKALLKFATAWGNQDSSVKTRARVFWRIYFIDETLYKVSCLPPRTDTRPLGYP